MRRVIMVSSIFYLVMAMYLLTVSRKAEAAETSTRSKIAVLDLQDQGVGSEVASLLTGVVSTRLSEIGIFDVISRDDVRNMLTHEQDKMLIGCSDASCYVDIGGVLGAQYLIAGSVGLVGKKYVVGLQRIDMDKKKVEKRVDRQFDGSRERLLQEVAHASYKVVEDILTAQSGTLLLSISEAGADISIDGKNVGVSPVQRLSVPAGPRDIRVAKDGFIDWLRTEQIAPKGVQILDVNMIPSAQFIQEYEQRAQSQRMWAWITLGSAVALEAVAIGLRTYTYLEIDPIEDDYNQGNYRGLTAEEFYQEYRDDMDRAETMDITALTAGVVGLGVGVLSAYFFLEGGDPDRYQRFRGMGSEPALPTVTLSPATGGGLFSWHFQF